MLDWGDLSSAMMDHLAEWFYGQIIGFLGNFFAVMGQGSVDLFGLSWVQAVVRFFGQLGWALFGVSLVVSCFESGIEYSAGRGNLRQTALNALKGFFAVSLFTTVPIRLYALSVSLQASFAAEITGLGSAPDYTLAELGQAVLQDLTSAGSLAGLLEQAHFGPLTITSGFMVIFCLILMAYAVLKVFFAELKRGGILLVQIAVGSLYMFSVPQGYTDGFTQWMKQVLGLCLTAFLQSTVLTAGLMVFGNHPLLGLGLMLSAGEVPRIAGAFGLDTSTKASLSSAVYTVQSAVNTTRTVAGAIK